MAVVTDKEYYLDDNLIAILEIAIKRQEKNWDNLILFDGDEGSGKSSMAIALGYYLAHKTKCSFSTDNIFFDVENMMDFASKTEKQIILWDEAALGGLSSQWSNRTQTKLIQALMVCRKKRHFWIFCIPKFYEMRIYLVRRALGLVHIYSPDGIERGYFTYYKKDLKNSLYYKVKKRMNEIDYRRFTFRGKFIKYDNIKLIDWEDYDNKKDVAIMDAFSKEEPVKVNKSFIRLKYLYASNRDVIDRIKAEKIGVGASSMVDWRKLKEKYPEFLENMEK